MTRRLLTILLAAVFAFQATGLTEALHLWMVSAPCQEQDHSAGDSRPAGALGRHVQADPGRHCDFHDPADCPICQATAALKVLPAAAQASAVFMQPLPTVAAAADRRIVLPSHAAPLIPRAPPGGGGIPAV